MSDFGGHFKGGLTVFWDPKSRVLGVKTRVLGVILDPFWGVFGVRKGSFRVPY